jgi:hypothetical protein
VDFKSESGIVTGLRRMVSSGHEGESDYGDVGEQARTLLSLDDTAGRLLGVRRRAKAVAWVDGESGELWYDYQLRCLCAEA